MSGRHARDCWAGVYLSRRTCVVPTIVSAQYFGWMFARDKVRDRDRCIFNGRPEHGDWHFDAVVLNEWFTINCCGDDTQHSLHTVIVHGTRLRRLPAALLPPYSHPPHSSQCANVDLRWGLKTLSATNLKEGQAPKSSIYG